MATTEETSITVGSRITRAVTALRHRARTEQSGFTIVESVVAITIAAMVFTATALMLGQALKGTLLARQNEQVAEVLTAEIEGIRSQDYAALAMVPADLVGDPAITAGSFDHDGTGPLPSQPLFVAPTGAITPHIRTVTVNSTDYRIARYVSEEIDPITNARMKRVTAIARWESAGRARERSSSTLVTRTRRGLPLPDFTWGPEREVIAAAGSSDVSFPVTLTNRGARDRWNLSVTSPGLPGAWTWYHDVDGDTMLSAGDVPLTDSDLDPSSLIDTGWVLVDETKHFVVVYGATVPSPSSPSYEVVLSARSSAQPDAPQGTATVTDHVTRPVTTLAGCPTCTVVEEHLLNTIPPCTITAGETCATKALDPLPLDAAAPRAATLPDYDTDIDTAAPELRAGRRLVEGGGTLVEASRAKAIRWSRQMGVATKVSTRAIVQVHVAPLATGGDTSVTFKAVVVQRPQGAGSDVVLGEAPATVTATGPGFQLVQLDVPLPASTSFGKNDRIEVRLVVVDDPTGTDALRVGYDASGHVSMVSYGVTS